MDIDLEGQELNLSVMRDNDVYKLAKKLIDKANKVNDVEKYFSLFFPTMTVPFNFSEEVQGVPVGAKLIETLNVEIDKEPVTLKLYLEQKDVEDGQISVYYMRIYDEAEKAFMFIDTESLPRFSDVVYEFKKDFEKEVSFYEFELNKVEVSAIYATDEVLDVYDHSIFKAFGAYTGSMPTFQSHVIDEQIPVFYHVESGELSACCEAGRMWVFIKNKQVLN